MTSVGALILAGGESKRMNCDKASLILEGTSFLERIARELSGFDERLLSVGRDGERTLPGFELVPDLICGAGPLGGIYSGLCACRSEYLMAVACDMPLFSRGLFEYAAAFFSPGCEAVVTVDRAGRTHPLCGIYAKRAALVLREQIKAGDYRLHGALSRLNVAYAPLMHSVYPDETVLNINTPEEYAALLQKVEGPPVVAISGVKNSGKTTLLTNLLPRLTAMGLRVAVVKHDGHDFIPDVPGTDSFRLRSAGAAGVAVYSGRRYLITEQLAGVSAETLIKRFSGMDLILIEGAKHSPYPKIEIVRAEVSCAPVCAPDTLLGVCTDTKTAPEGVPALELEDYDGLVALLLRHIKRGG